jgi:hypothetical protein
MECDMGTFTLLDAELVDRQAPVRLSSADAGYFDPDLGEPFGQTFVDEKSLLSSRLFGQGAALSVRRYSLIDRPVPR